MKRNLTKRNFLVASHSDRNISGPLVLLERQICSLLRPLPPSTTIWIIIHMVTIILLYVWNKYGWHLPKKFRTTNSQWNQQNKKWFLKEKEEKYHLLIHFKTEYYILFNCNIFLSAFLNSSYLSFVMYCMIIVYGKIFLITVFSCFQFISHEENFFLFLITLH